jgi:hypothetical protein
VMHMICDSIALKEPIGMTLVEVKTKRSKRAKISFLFG